MAFFSWKKNDGDKKSPGADANPASSGGASEPPSSAPASPAPAPGAYEFSPDKARRFFDRAATVHEATNFEYAMSMWLSGLRQDPTSMAGLEGFFKSAASFLANGGKAVPKDLAREFAAKTELDKFLRAILEWGIYPADAANAVAALQAASTLGLASAATWIAPRALGAASREKKPRKDHFIAVMESMRKFELYDKAVEAGEAALRLDPTDAKLGALIRNISAESTMSRGGFDDAGREGGFRANIRDAARQKLLEDESKVVKTEETQDRLVEQARADYETNKLDRPNTIRYIQRLLERAQPDDENVALEVAQDAYKHSQEYRFLEQAEQIRLRQARRKVARLKAAAEAPAADDDARRVFKAALREYVEAETRVYEGQVKAYPTDLLKKYELGKRYFQLARFEDAIGQLQEAKADIKHRAAILNLLGQAFAQIGWSDEAVETLRQALDSHSDPRDNHGMGYRYDLMQALLTRAAEHKDLSNADEAYKIASSIAIEQINFREIRAKRDEIKQLIAQLRSP